MWPLRRPLGAQCVEIGQHVNGVAGRILYVIGLADRARWIDQETVARRKIRVRLIWRFRGAVQGADGSVAVGEQRVRELVLLLELLVISGRVERNAENAAIGSCELWGSITESLALTRSTRC